MKRLFKTVSIFIIIIAVMTIINTAFTANGINNSTNCITVLGQNTRKGWQTINGKTYFYNSKGVMLKGWQIALIGVGVLVVLIGIIAGIKALVNKKKKREEDELASSIDDLLPSSETRGAESVIPVAKPAADSSPGSEDKEK